MVDTREDFVIFRSNEYTAPLWGTRDDDEIVLGQMFTIFADLLSEFLLQIDLYFSTQMIKVTRDCSH